MSSFIFFYRYIRYRVFLNIVIRLFISILDGFGLAMFLPLLQIAGNNGQVNPEGLGNLQFLLDGFNSLEVEITITTVLLFLSFLFILKGIIAYFGVVYGVTVRQYFIRKLRLQLVNGLNNISYKAFSSSDAGRIQNTMSGEADKVMRAYIYYFRSFEQLIMVFVYMGFAFFVDIQFAVLVLIGGILTNFIYNRVYRLTKKASVLVTKHANLFQGLIIQHVANFKYLKATGLLEKFGLKLKSTIYDLENNNKKIGVYNALVSALREPVLIIVVSAVIIFQTKLLGSDLGPILISLLFFYRALSSLMNMQTSWNSFLGVSGSTKNMSSFLADLSSMKEKKGEQAFKRFTEELSFNNLGISFGNKTVLENVNLEIKKNETVAFVGESGSGKSTFVGIVAGLLPPDRGTYKIDGISLEKIHILQFQKRIGYITQDPVIFNDSIFNNVTFWDVPNENNKQKFWQALQKASLDNYILELEDREETLLGNYGINLSGGQKQRISIARELYKDIDILIMDEATSALDSETEKSIQENIDALKGTYTILIVAHRLSTIKNADRIVFLDNGTIVNIDSFEGLLTKNDRFKKMVELQEFKD